MNIRSEGLTYDDIMLVPQYSKVKHRADIDVSCKLGSLEFKHPLIVANMATTMSVKMGQEIIKSGGLAILHRFDDWNTQYENYNKIFGEDPIKSPHLFQVCPSIGIQENYEDFWPWFQLAPANMFCLDVAHCDNKYAIDTIKFLKSHKSKVGYDPFIIAGNVGTYQAARRLFEAGADAIKVGLSMGAICSTAVQTGFGSPMVTAINEIHDMRQRLFPDRGLIADGGIKNSGDIVKALSLGADMVMIGSLFAGCDEAPGTRRVVNGISYKEYNGSSTHKNKNIEGVKGLVKCTKPYAEILNGLLDGIRSGCSYAGVNSITELREDSEFYRITSNTLTLSHPHDIIPG